MYYRGRPTAACFRWCFSAGKKTFFHALAHLREVPLLLHAMYAPSVFTFSLKAKVPGVLDGSLLRYCCPPPPHQLSRNPSPLLIWCPCFSRTKKQSRSRGRTSASTTSAAATRRIATTEAKKGRAFPSTRERSRGTGSVGEPRWRRGG